MNTATRHRIAIGAGLCSLGLILAARSVAAEQPAPKPEEGRAAYGRYCARCHGDLGKGDGVDAKRLFPRPRDLTSGVFKFRTTASGSAPTDQDLLWILHHGLAAGNMPDWSNLDEGVREQLVAYLKTLTTVFTDAPPEPVQIGQDPGSRHVDLQTGKAVYEKLGCAACHGPQGRANGPSASSFQDNWGQPTRPADLTLGLNYRAGSDPKSITERILTGIDGTPMPSYAEAATTEEAWQLAYYVQSLQETPRWAAMLHASKVDGALPMTVDAPEWRRAVRVDVRLRNAMTAGGEVTAAQTIAKVSVQGLYNDESLALLLTWHDPSEDRTPEAADVLAVALRPDGVAGDTVTLQAWPLRDSPALDLCVWSASRVEGGAVAPAQETLASRYEQALDRMARGLPLGSQAVYSDGEWRLVLTRPLAPHALANRAARFREHVYTPVGFVIWDGGNPGQRAVSPWLDVMLGTIAERHDDHEEPEQTGQSHPAGVTRTMSSASRSEQVEQPRPTQETPHDSANAKEPASVLVIISAVIIVAALALAVRKS